MVTPLLFTFFAKPRKIWRERIKIFAIPIALALLANVILFFFLKQSEKVRVSNEITREVDELASTIEEDLEDHVDILYALSDFYASSKFVDRDEFRIFTSRFLDFTHKPKAIEWVPRIKAEERESFEQKVSAEQVTFRITERHKPSGRVIPALTRKEYFPIYYVEPLESNKKALGYDLGSDVYWQSVLEKAIDLGSPAATSRIKLVQDKGIHRVMSIFMPIYKNGSVVETIEQRRDSLFGFVSAVYYINELFKGVIGEGGRFKGFRIVVQDLTESEKPEVIFDNEVYLIKYSEDYLNNLKELKTAPFVQQREILFGVNKWHIHFYPKRTFLTELTNWQIWMTKTFSMVGTAILGLFLLMISGRTYETEQLVVERTKELEKANDDLEQIIHNQYETENALRLSQESFRTLVQNIPGAVYRCANDEHRTVEFISEHIFDLSGFKIEEFQEEGNSINHLINEEDRNKVLDKVSDALNSEKPFEIEYRIKHKDSKTRWIYDEGRGYKTADGQLKWIDGVMFDVTDRKLIEERINKEKDRLERFQRLTVNREKQMIQLKEEINTLCQSLGQPNRYEAPDNIKKNKT